MKLHRRPAPQFAPAIFLPAITVGAILVFFVLQSGSLLLQSGIPIEPPPSPFFVNPHREPLIIAVTAAPVPAIYFNNFRTNPGMLDEALAKVQSDSRLVVIKADRLAPVDLVVQVFNIATKHGLNVMLATAESNP